MPTHHTWLQLKFFSSTGGGEDQSSQGTKDRKCEDSTRTGHPWPSTQTQPVRSSRPSKTARKPCHSSSDTERREGDRHICSCEHNSSRPQHFKPSPSNGGHFYVIAQPLYSCTHRLRCLRLQNSKDFSHFFLGSVPAHQRLAFHGAADLAPGQRVGFCISLGRDPAETAASVSQPEGQRHLEL